MAVVQDEETLAEHWLGLGTWAPSSLSVAFASSGTEPSATDYSRRLLDPNEWSVTIQSNGLYYRAVASYPYFRWGPSSGSWGNGNLYIVGDDDIIVWDFSSITPFNTRHCLDLTVRSGYGFATEDAATVWIEHLLRINDYSVSTATYELVFPRTADSDPFTTISDQVDVMDASLWTWVGGGTNEFQLDECIQWDATGLGENVGITWRTHGLYRLNGDPFISNSNPTSQGTFCTGSDAPLFAGCLATAKNYNPI